VGWCFELLEFTWFRRRRGGAEWPFRLLGVPVAAGGRRLPSVGISGSENGGYHCLAAATGDKDKEHWQPAGVHRGGGGAWTIGVSGWQGEDGEE
jgi:hypothetical protein